jgi:hypothetical protein
LRILDIFVLAAGSICAFTFLAWVYVKSQSIIVASFAHIVLNNSARSLGYFAVVENQLLANLGLTIALLIVVIILYYSDELRIFETYFARDYSGKPKVQ